MDDGQFPIDPAVGAISPQNATEKKAAEVPTAAIPPGPETPPPQPHQEETCTCRPDQTPWWKGTLEIIALSIGICGLIVYWNQLKVMSGQLTQMQGSSIQTDKLICLYRQQLTQLTKQASGTHDLAVSAGEQADQALIQAKATQALAKTSRDALIVVQRAFVFPDTDLPLMVRKSDGPPPTIAFTVVFENSGFTPTKNLAMHINWVPVIQGGPEPPFDDIKVNGVVPPNTNVVMGPRSNTTVVDKCATLNRLCGVILRHG
jgi:hypothetical protein